MSNDSITKVPRNQETSQEPEGGGPEEAQGTAQGTACHSFAGGTLRDSLDRQFGHLTERKITVSSCKLLDSAAAVDMCHPVIVCHPSCIPP